MFYSQFILAKKGPLGTIWIAAHLERKLRKNQVADTDIGVSVDSILAPDIPIALRLSSHLLLGVVRIYSRKVNYLFHDCSETLLKVKQAFRSTVVDLPPEESTAPYHSITLPETFDLDDFVLPDTALNSNFVDHHVSTREQITLQDTVEGAGYSRSQFGLDERFGDGDASQIGLDLDEELFLDKGLASHDVSALLGSEEKMENQMSGLPETPFTDMDIDGCQDECGEHGDAEVPKDMLGQSRDNLGMPNRDAGFSNLHGYNIQTPDLNEMVLNETVGTSSVGGGPSTELLDHAHAPSTPGILEEAIPANVQEAPTLSPQGKISPSNNDILPDNTKLEPETRDLTYENGTHPSLNEMGTSEANVEAIPEEGQRSIANAESVTLNSDHSVTDALVTSDIGSSLHKDEAAPLDPSCQDFVEAVDGCPSKVNLKSDASLKQCSSHVNDTNAASFEGQLSSENDPQPSGTEMITSDTLANASGSLLESQELEMHRENQTGHSKPDKPSSDDVSNGARLEVLNCSASSEYPEPEKMLLAPPSEHGFPDELGQYTAEKEVIESGGRADRIISLSGKKRHLAESTSALQEGSSVKLSGAPRSQRNVDYIPDDDDLLASILVGRGSSALKMKSTASLPVAPFPKRSRLNPKVGAPKRKVLLDDTMVLHADAIRQQLMNTEDIRRTRKKAPCTRSEIWTIQKCFSEEVFAESVLTGMSAEMAQLLYLSFDPNETLSAEIVEDHFLSETSKEDFPRSLPPECGPSVSCEGADNPTVTVALQNDMHTHSSLGGDAFSSAALTDEPHLNLELKSSVESLQPPENGDIIVPAEDMCIMEEGPNASETRNGDIISEPFVTSPHVVGVLNNVNNEAVSAVDISTEVGSDKHVESTNLVGNASICDPDLPMENGSPNDPSSLINDQTTEEVREGMEVPIGDQVLSFSCPPQLSSDAKMSTSTVGECSGLTSNLESVVDLENAEVFPAARDCLESSVDMENPHAFSATRDSIDFGSAVGVNDTEFLNVDDEADFYEEASYDVPNPDEDRSLENSGWSARTRGVARYLRSLFDDESGYGRRNVVMDRLLAGKTRKEASRMFFETLVLKTRDYIHVEQENSFESIDIKPRAKLLKSEL